MTPPEQLAVSAKLARPWAGRRFVSPAEPLPRLRLGALALGVLGAAVASAWAVLRGPERPALAALAVLAVAITGARWLRAEGRPATRPLLAHAADAVAIALATALAGPAGATLLHAGVLHRSLSSPPARALAGAGLLVAGFLAGGAVTSAMALAHVPVAFVVAGLASVLGVTIAGQERAARRERAVRAATAALAWAPDVSACERIVAGAALDAIGRPAGVSARIVDRTGAGYAGMVVLEPSATDADAADAEALEALTAALTLAPAVSEHRERRGEQLCRKLVGAASDLFMVIDVDGRTIFHSPSVNRELGHGVEELLERRIADFVHPEDIGALNALLARAAADGGRHGPVEWRLRRAQGGWLDVEAMATGLVDDPEVGGIVLSARDITRRREILGALSESRRRLQAVLENTTAMVLVTDASGRCVLANRQCARLLGVSQRALIGRRLGEVLPAEVAGGLEDHSREVLRVGRPLQFDEILGLDGEERHLLATKVPLFGPDGEPDGVCSISTDITERMRALREKEELETTLAHSQRMDALGKLAGGVAHDFNNLLAVILNYTDFVAERLEPEDPSTADLARVSRAAQRAAELTQHLLVFSRREPSRPEVINVNDVIAETDDLLRRTLPGEVSLVTIPATDAPRVRADESRLQQVLVNLVVNARDALDGGGTVTVAASSVALPEAEARLRSGLRSGRHVRIVVTDDGAGMDAAVARRAFEPFFTTKPSGEGTGLGLATVYGMITGAGGHVELSSSPGSGTQVTIHLPLVEAAAPAAVDPEAAEPASGRSRGTVLVVEDEAAVRELTRRILSRDGYTVIETSDAAEALALCREPADVPDLLLTDVVMPLVSGRDLSDRLRELNPGLRVLFMSGYTDRIMLRYGVDDSADDLLQKPFNGRQLLDAVARTLRETP